MDIQKQNMQLVPAANGETTAVFYRKDGRELYLHSRVDPTKEARSLVLKTTLRENTLYVILGVGFGYHIRELLKKIPQSSRIIVVESSAASFGDTVQQYYNQLGKAWIRDKRLSFTAVNDPGVVSYILVDLFIKNHLYYLEMFTHIPSAMADEKFYRGVVEIVPQEFAIRLSDGLATSDPTLEHNLINYWSNLEITWKNPPIDRFADQWEGKPSIIVSAGPSLTAQLDNLRKLQGKILIICVGTAAKVLIDHGIFPDLVIAVDPYETSMAQFEGWNTEQSALLYYQKAWRDIPAAYQGLKFWFTLQDESPIPAHESVCNSNFAGGGTVAFSALQFARYIKSDPIILVGQDFAFLNGFTHAIGTDYNQSFSEEKLPEGFFKVPGTNGDLVITNRMYYSYLKFMQEYICRWQDTCYINTSQTGAKIEGTQEMSLEEVMNLFCGFPTNSGEKIKNIWNTYQPKETKNVAILLQVCDKEIRHFLATTNIILDFEKVCDKFKKLQVYKLNRNNFDEVFYVIEMKEKWFGIPSRSDAVKRLKAHVEFILQKIGQMQEKR